MDKVFIYTDGACTGNPGPGGWGAILQFGKYRKEISGGEGDTTNNRMELSAVINALSALRRPCDVTLTTDSRYVCDSVTKGWLHKWESEGFDRRQNRDLWKRVLELIEIHNVEFRWVKGHAGHPENERCDELATAEARKRS